MSTPQLRTQKRKPPILRDRLLACGNYAKFPPPLNNPFNWGNTMNRAYLFGLAFFILSGAAASAGPCTSEIDTIEKAVNAPNSMFGPTARQTVGAQDSHQPTAESMARAEKKADTHYQDILNEAKALDAANNPKCQEVVKKVKDLVGM
jgi:hypothetical protein